MTQAFQRAAVEVVGLARSVSLQALPDGVERWQKADASIVTAADLAVEKLLRAELAMRFPDHGLQGEEFPPANVDARYQWHMDPIDGTLSFARGLPLWGTLLGLFLDGQPLVGVIDMPALGRCYHAARGCGAFCDDRKLVLADVAPGAAADEPLAIADRARFVKVGRAPLFDRLMTTHGRAWTSNDCFGHALAATGGVGACFDVGLRSWDLAGSQVLIEEAGGRYEVVGEHAAPDGGTFYDVVMGKPTVVAWLLEAIARG